MIIPQISILVLCITGAALGQSTCETNRLNAVKSGKAVPQGANLGSWLVLEGWITKSLWDDNGCSRDTHPGSYLLEKCLGSKAKSVLDKHWSTWITENDFAEMSKHGINLVRIPVGWWHIYDPQGGADKADLNYYISPKNYTVGGLAYLDKAFDWGKKHGIAILVDLHAAPGSQNGNDHSSPSNPGQVYWDKYDDNIGQSVDSLELYAERYAKKEALFGFQLLNEPGNVDRTKMQDYYKKAYAAIRKHSTNSYIVINPSMTPFEYGTESYWTNFMNPDQGYTKVAMDLHYYSCFNGAGDSTDADFNIDYINTKRVAQIKEFKEKNPKLQIIGEWSACQHGDSARTPDFLKAEVKVFSTASLGFTFWSWKVPNSTPWSLQDAFKKNWIGNFNTPC